MVQRREQPHPETLVETVEMVEMGCEELRLERQTSHQLFRQPWTAPTTPSSSGEFHPLMVHHEWSLPPDSTPPPS